MSHEANAHSPLRSFRSIPRLQKRSARWIAAAAAAFPLITGGGLLAASSNSAAAPAASTAYQHYLCYNAAATNPGFVFPGGVTLVNQLAPNGIRPSGGPAVVHCNPAIKQISTTPLATYPITEPAWHQLCFVIKAASTQARVAVTNQFGQGTFTTGTPNLLCLPTWKSLTGLPNQTPNQPPGEDHYTCYTLTSTGGKFAAPAAVHVSDEFSPKLVGVKVGSAQDLCVPTEKILASGVAYPVNNPTLSYLCFTVSRTPIIKPVYDENQFGTGPVGIKATKWLCLPSQVQVVAGAASRG